MMKIYKTFMVFIAIVLLNACTSAQLSQIGGILNSGTLSTEEVAQGLKQALENGTNKGTDMASKVDGYFKNPKIRIPLPPEMQRVENTLRQVGLGAEVDRFALNLNRAAEKAAIEAKPIFLSAVRSLTIQDAWNILRGDQDAATQFLRRTTYNDLRGKFQPIVQSALNSVNVTKYYDDLARSYNRIPGVTKINDDLNDFATSKAIDGLFLLIAEEEANIRANPAARTTELLKRVFSQTD